MGMSTQFSLSTSQAEYDELKRFCREVGRPMSWVLRDALALYLAEVRAGRSVPIGQYDSWGRGDMKGKKRGRKEK